VNSGTPASERIERALRRQRRALLARITRAVEPVMVVLSAVWIALLVVELVGDGLPRSLEAVLTAIWLLFGLDFAARLLVAPDRLAFIRGNWLTLLSLVLPALRVVRAVAALRVLRAVRVTRSVGLLRVVTSLNRGLGALGRTAQRRGIGYMLAATGLVLVVGAAAMSFFERTALTPGTGTAFDDFGEALWWTANTMTTGPIEQPRTPEGRLFGWLLSVYGLAAFGYLTAILASHFVAADRDRGDARSSAPQASRRSEPRSAPDGA
jgi:voltage-gated potassium channel